MSTKIPVLLRMLSTGGASHAFSLEDPGARLDDEPVDLVIARTAALGTRGGALPITLEDPPMARAVLDRCPGSVWLCQLRPGERRGTLVPFSPPRVVRLATAIPVLLPAALRDKAREHDLRPGDDLLSGARITSYTPLGEQVRARTLAVIGQRTISALGPEDGSKITLWMRDGDAIEAIVVQQEGRVHLQLLGFVRAQDQQAAHSGPSVLIELALGAGLPLVEAEEGAAVAGVPTEAALCFQPQRSRILDIWAEYLQLARKLGEAREQARAAAPLPFIGAHQREKHWVAEVSLTPEAHSAWLAAGPGHRREIKVDQTVAVYGENEAEPVGNGTIEKMRLLTPGRARVHLRPDRALRVVPDRGRLKAVENRGAAVERQRQREALEVLQAGRASCPKLIDVLADPALASEPRQVHPIEPGLDPAQQRAVALILGCQDLVAIQGPPGTGKTRVIVAALKRLAAQGTRERPVRVLISSVQNEAINNVAERLANDRILIHRVRRQGRDEDESHEVGTTIDQMRQHILGELEARLHRSGLLGTLERLRQQHAELGHLRVLVADEGARAQCAEALRELCETHDLPTLYREAGLRLAEQLRREAEASTSTPPTNGPDVPAPDEPAAAPAPAAPACAEEAEAWWQTQEPLWPTASRAEISLAVRQVAEAASGAAQNPLRFGERKRRHFDALLQLLARIPRPPTASAPAPAAAAACPDDWIGSVEAELLMRERPLLDDPDVIAQRFLQRLREDPEAWHEIQRRHSCATLATCSMAARAHQPDEPPYDWVIIDEAGRASPYELLVPMVKGRRVVLIGDHRQLPPLVEDEVADALERERTPIADIRRETLFEALYQGLPAPCRERLCVQYRMHGDIGELVDLLFYRPKNERVDSYHAGARAVERRPLWGVLQDRPLALLDTGDRGGASPYENQAECEVVLELLEAFARAPDAQPAHIGVICAYADQRNLLQRRWRERLRERPDPLKRITVEVRTIDAVQGREYPAVIFCTVRRDGRAGFLAAPNRVNVAISRAQRQLIILGSQHALDQGRLRAEAPHLGQLLDHCRHRALVVPVLGGQP